MMIKKGCLILNNKKSKAILFSIIPGAGHMYLGLMNEGIQLMTLFFSSIFIGDWLHLDIFIMMSPIIWFFSLFDAREKSMSTEILEDSDVIFIKWLKSTKILNKDSKKVFGFLLIFVGAISLLERIICPYLEIYLNINITGYIQTFIVSIIFIFLGIKLLLQNKTQSN